MTDNNLPGPGQPTPQSGQPGQPQQPYQQLPPQVPVPQPGPHQQPGGPPAKGRVRQQQAGK
ncbi:hypothetical protein FXN61_02235, partial [Lentzea sp. PSKA42]